jgi:hypothetical protein
VLSLFFILTILFAPLARAEEKATSSRGFSWWDGDDGFLANIGNLGKNLATQLSMLGSEPVMALKVPILFGVAPKNITDSWGDARSGGRSHEGTDIMAPRGALIVCPTKAIVSSIGYGANGGNYVYTVNPGGERYYFAHLDKVAEGLEKGKVLEPGDLIGYVGNTGNASGGATHLHFGIYKSGATNPYPRLTSEFSLEERITAITKILGQVSDPASLAKSLASQYAGAFTEARTKGITLPQLIAENLGGTPLAKATGVSVNAGFVRDLKLGMAGEDVRSLQKFLNAQSFAVSASGAGSKGNETTYFGPATQKALIAFQKSKGINPAVGYFGVITRGYVTAIA